MSDSDFSGIVRTVDETPKCPKCKCNAGVTRTKGCKCFSCPPWICHACESYQSEIRRLNSKANSVVTYGYDFFDDDED